MDARIVRRAILPIAVFTTVLGALTGASVGGATVAKSAPPSPIKSLVASLNGLSPKARETKLYNQAKTEGEVDFYTSLSKLIGPAVVDAFEAKYPGVKVNMYRASSEDVTARVYQEAAANTAGADVVETNGTEMLFFQHRKNILIPYRQSPYAKQIPAAYRFDTFTADRIEDFVVAWNTNLVKPGSEPKTWADLAQPQWAGKIAMEPSDVDWFAGAFQYMEKQQLAKLKKAKTKAGQAKQLANVDKGIQATFQKMAKNAQIVSGHTTQATLLAAGQFSVVVSAHAQSVNKLIDKGAPVALKPFVQPVLVRPQGVGIAYRLKHPAAALLFYDFLLSPAGQKVLQDNGSEPARNGMDSPELVGAKRYDIDLRPIVSHFKAWSDRYDALMRLGKTSG